MAVSYLLLGLFTPNLGMKCKVWSALYDYICGSIVANPIIYRLVTGPSRFENRQYTYFLEETPNGGRVLPYMGYMFSQEIIPE